MTAPQIHTTETLLTGTSHLALALLSGMTAELREVVTQAVRREVALEAQLSEARTQNAKLHDKWMEAERAGERRVRGTADYWRSCIDRLKRDLEAEREAHAALRARWAQVAPAPEPLDQWTDLTEAHKEITAQAERWEKRATEQTAEIAALTEERTALRDDLVAARDRLSQHHTALMVILGERGVGLTLSQAIEALSEDAEATRDALQRALDQAEASERAAGKRHAELQQAAQITDDLYREALEERDLAEAELQAFIDALPSATDEDGQTITVTPKGLLALIEGHEDDLEELRADVSAAEAEAKTSAQRLWLARESIATADRITAAHRNLLRRTAERLGAGVEIDALELLDEVSALEAVAAPVESVTVGVSATELEALRLLGECRDELEVAASWHQERGDEEGSERCEALQTEVEVLLDSLDGEKEAA